MKLYISADIEGVAGVTTRDQGGPEGFEYDKGREWMTGEVRAACEGASVGGASEIVISDSHGNGQNLRIDDLPEDVRVIRSWPRPLGMMEGIQEGGFDAAFFIGYHAGATNTAGNLAHTIYGLVIRSVRINGEIASEAYLSAATAGDYDIPVALISGDDAFIAETAAFLPSATTVTTKQALGTLSASSISPTKSRALIREAARQAMTTVAEPESSAKPLRVPAPITLEIEFKHRLPAELLDYLPNVSRRHAYAIEYEATDMSDVSRFLSFVTSYNPMLL
ncbi:MAG: M55 family metallopeptidase [Pseudomonadota bacterium]